MPSKSGSFLFPTGLLVVGGLLAMAIAAVVTHDAAEAVFGLGLLIIGSTLAVVAYLDRILYAIEEGGGKVETVLKQRLH